MPQWPNKGIPVHDISFETYNLKTLNDIRHDRHQKSALAEHAHHSRHHIRIEETKLIAREEHCRRRKIREAIEIEEAPSNLNRDDGLKLNESWRPIIHRLRNNIPHTKNINPSSL